MPSHQGWGEHARAQTEPTLPGQVTWAAQHSQGVWMSNESVDSPSAGPTPFPEGPVPAHDPISVP